MQQHDIPLDAIVIESACASLVATHRSAVECEHAYCSLVDPHSCDHHCYHCHQYHQYANSDYYDRDVELLAMMVLHGYGCGCDYGCDWRYCHHYCYYDNMTRDASTGRGCTDEVDLNVLDMVSMTLMMYDTRTMMIWYHDRYAECSTRKERPQPYINN